MMEKKAGYIAEAIMDCHAIGRINRSQWLKEKSAASPEGRGVAGKETAVFCLDFIMRRY